jgi:hypothetical protein
MRDKGQGTRDKGQGTRDKGQGTRDKGQVKETTETSSVNIISIYFERSGGFTAIPLQAEIPAKAFNKEEAEEVVSLLEHSGFFNFFSPGKPEGRVPDQFIYRIEVERTDIRHDVMVYEQQVTDDLRPLIRFLTRKARGI